MTRPTASLGTGFLAAILLALTLSPPSPGAVLSVDFGQAGQQVQADFEEFSGSGITGSPVSMTYANGVGNGNSVTVQLNPVLGNIEWRDRGDTVIHPIGDVVEDLAFTRDTMELRLQNLKAGTLYFRSYHHDTPHQQGSIDVLLTDAARTGRLMMDNVVQSGADSPPRTVFTVPLIIQADGTGDVVVGIKKNGVVGLLNGFEITDSPPADLRVDIGAPSTGSSTNDVQAGFQSFATLNDNGSAANGYINSPQEHWLFTEMANAGSARVNVSTPAGTLGFRDRGDVSHALGDLAEDFVFNSASQRLDLTLGSLQPGLYSLTAYLHDRNGAFPGTIDVRVSDAVGAERLGQAGIVSTAGASPAEVATATVQFASNGIDPVVIHFDEATANTIVTLNAFEAAKAAPSLRVDFALETAGHDVQNGFLPFTSSSPETGDGFTETFSGKLGRGENVTVRLEGYGDALRWRDRGDVVNAELGDMAEDFVFSDRQLEMVLEGLPASRYLITTYHTDPNFPTHGSIDIEVDDALGTGRSIVTDLNMPGLLDGDAAAATFEFLANGPVTIRFTESDPGNGGTYVMFNGFALTAVVPEPSTFVLAGLGLCGLAVVALRRKRR